MNKQFDFSSFIERIIDKDYFEMIASAESEAHTAESISSGIKGSVENREAGSLRYVRKLKKFLFFMKNIEIPKEADIIDKGLYKKAIKALIKKGFFGKSVLDVFKV